MATKKVFLSLLLLGAGLLLMACGGASSGPGTVVVHNGMLIDGLGGEPVMDAAVVIEDGVIVAVGPESEIEIPARATMIDAQGGAIMPGLIDTHVHVLNELELEDGTIDNIGATAYLLRPLQSGVTTMRDLGSDAGQSREFDDIRAALGALGNQTPTILISGPLLAAPDNEALRNWPDQALAIEDVTAAQDTANRLLDEGADQIKVYVETGFDPNEQTPTLTDEQISAIVDAAHERGAYVTAHVSDIAEAEQAIANGVDQLAHWPGPENLPASLVADIVDRDMPVVSTFIFGTFEGDVRRFLEAGGTIIMGSDAPGTMPAAGIAKELSFMVLYGMTSMEVIQASTAYAAQALGLGDHTGTLEVGKEADIIVVEGNPAENIRAMRDVVVVINNGEVILVPDSEEE